MNSVVLVTGGSGFIGTWVLREMLSRGARPIVVDTQPAPARWRRVLGEQATTLLEGVRRTVEFYREGVH